MSNLIYSIGPWVRRAGNSGMPQGYWDRPDGTIAKEELRGNPDQSLIVGGDRPFGFFATPEALPSEYANLGTGDLREINSTAAMKSAWLSFMGYEPQGTTLLDLLVDQITNGSDPTYSQDRVPTRMPDSKGLLRIYMKGHVDPWVWSEQFRYGPHPHTNKVQAVLHHRHRRIRAEVDAGRMSMDQERMVLDKSLEKYGISKTNPAAWKQLVPPELRSGHPGPLLHQTIIGDTFVEASDTNLESHTATGPNGGHTYTRLVGNEGEAFVESANDRLNVTGPNEYTARADQDLSSDDHRVQSEVTRNDDTGTTAAGLIWRKDSSATLTYMLCQAFYDDGDLELFKNIAGSFTLLAEDAAFTFASVNTFETLYGESNGDEHRVLFNGSQELIDTDSNAAAGNLRCGFRGVKVSGASLLYDDFEAEDLPPSIIYNDRKQRFNTLLRL